MRGKLHVKVHDSEGSCVDIPGMSLRTDFVNLPNKYALSVCYVSVLDCWDSTMLGYWYITASKTHVSKGAGREEGSLGHFYKLDLSV